MPSNANQTWPTRLILIGPPGVGKGTQASLLQGRLGLIPLSSGAIFRQEMDAGTELGLLAKGYMQRGELVPDSVTVDMMASRLRQDDVRLGGFVLDGFPRTIQQAEALQRLLEDMGLQLDKVVYLQVDDEVVVERLSGRLGCQNCGEIFHKTAKPPAREGICDKCGGPLTARPDDRPETIRERMRVFREQTAPVAEFYKRIGLLFVVDGSLDPETVYKGIVAA